MLDLHEGVLREFAERQERVQKHAIVDDVSEKRKRHWYGFHVLSAYKSRPGRKRHDMQQRWDTHNKERAEKRKRKHIMACKKRLRDGYRPRINRLSEKAQAVWLQAAQSLHIPLR